LTAGTAPLAAPRRWKEAIIWFRPPVMEPAINRLEFASGTMAPTREGLRF
jgi:hypothetical protein